MRKQAVAYVKTKPQISCAIVAQLISAFGFFYMDSTITILSKSENSSLQPSSLGLQPGLCQTWSETPKTVFLTTRLNIKSREGDGIFQQSATGCTVVIKGTDSSLMPLLIPSVPDTNCKRKERNLQMRNKSIHSKKLN